MRHTQRRKEKWRTKLLKDQLFHPIPSLYTPSAGGIKDQKEKQRETETGRDRDRHRTAH